MSQISSVYRFELGGLRDNSKEGLTPSFNTTLNKVVAEFNAQRDEAHSVTADNTRWLGPGVMAATFRGTLGSDVQQCASRVTRLLCGSLKASVSSTVVLQESSAANPGGLDAILT